jgi:hypothetical protein
VGVGAGEPEGQGYAGLRGVSVCDGLRERTGGVRLNSGGKQPKM